MLRVKIALGWVVVFSLLNASIAYADGSEEEAEQHFSRGVELFHGGDFAQAVIAFERAYELKPSYKLLWNVAQVENELKHYARSLAAYVRYLADGGSDISAERVQAAKKEIARLNTLVGSIVVECDLPGALVLVDRRREGETPLASPVFVDIGEHDVVVKSGAEELHSELVRVAGGQKVVVEVATGAAKPPAEAGAEPLPRPLPESGRGAEEVGDVGGVEVDPEDDGPRRVWTWVALGVGGASLVAAASVGGAAMAKREDLTKSCANEVCPTSQEGEADTISEMNLTADVLYGVAAAAVIAGSVLFFVETGMGDDEGEAAVAVAPVVAPNGGGFVIEGRF